MPYFFVVVNSRVRRCLCFSMVSQFYTAPSEMLDNGVSLREIQLMLGHSSIQTTIQYLDTHDFNSISRGKLENKIKEIHDNTVNHQNTSFSEIEDTKDNDDTISVSFSTPLAQCKNIFDPHQFDPCRQIRTVKLGRF